MTDDNKQNRSRLFVNNKIQGRTLLQIAFYWGAYHIVLWHAMFLFRYFQYQAEVEQGGKALPFVDFFGGFVQQHYSMLICAALVFPFILWDTLKFTHRIAGPLQRFQTTLKAMTEGRTAQKIQIRKGDLLFDLQESFNEYVGTLQFHDETEQQTKTPEIMQEEEASILGDLMNQDKTKNVC